MQPTQGTFLGITPVSFVSNCLYFLTLSLVSIMRVIYTSKGMSKKFGVRVIHYVRVIYRKIRHILATVNKVSNTKMKTGPGAHPACYTMGTWSLLGVKWLGQGINHPSPSSTLVKKTVELYL